MQVILNESDDIEQTVAMPCFNAKNIAWLSMESLCNQINIDYHWELLICEEQHENMAGIDLFKQYTERLYNVGCRRIVYILLPEWVRLIEKWIILGKAAHVNSKSFILKAVDCYSPAKRLSITYDAINRKGFEWVDFTKGYFYNIKKYALIVYNKMALTNLNMAFKTDFARKIPETTRNKGIDGFLYRSFGIRKKYMVRCLYQDSIDTDGFNNISKRSRYYDNPTAPFYRTDKNIDNLNISDYVKTRLKQMRTI